LIDQPSDAPCVQRSQRSLRVLLQSEYRLLGQALGLGDNREGRRAGAVESQLNALERSPVIGRLASEVCIGLRSPLVVNAGPLGGLGSLGLCLVLWLP
jgi:hypothetical protein